MAKIKPQTVTMARYVEACKCYEGWCCECEAFTTGCCEPDARRYECESCGGRSVYGVEEALTRGMIDIGEPAPRPSVLAKYMDGGE